MPTFVTTSTMEVLSETAATASAFWVLVPRAAASTTDQAYGGNVGSLVVVERAIAKRNGQNGLSLVGQGLIPGDEDGFQYGINAEIIRGVYNRNDQNGVYLRNLGDVFLDNPTGVANRDDGFDGSNIVNVFGDWTFVANGDQDFVLS